MEDEKYYQIVADEIRGNRINDALWTKAIAKSMGDEQKTKAVYIQLRVDQLMAEDKRARAATNNAGVNEADEGEGTEEGSEEKGGGGVNVGMIVRFIIGLAAIIAIVMASKVIMRKLGISF